MYSIYLYTNIKVTIVLSTGHIKAAHFHLIFVSSQIVKLVCCYAILFKNAANKQQKLLILFKRKICYEDN